MAPATSAELTKKYSGAAPAAVRKSAAAPRSPPSSMPIGRLAMATVIVSDATLNTTRCTGFRPVALSVHWAHAPAAAMRTLGAGPSANRDQKFTACESDRFDWLRPSGRAIFAA